MLKMPTDVDSAYAGSWDAFLELPETKGLDQKVIEEGFRILLQQAGTKIRTRFATKDFFTVNKLYTEFSRALTSKFLLTHLKPLRHTFEIVLDADPLVNVVHGFKVVGQAKLKPQRFDLNYLLNRMVHVKVLKEFPEALKLSSRKMVRDGKQVTITKDRCPANISQLKPWQEVTLVVNPKFKIVIARLKGDYLALKYEVYFHTEMPLYKDTEKQLSALWRGASIGDLQ
uniref:Uncharacterized protein n=1 Tax=Pseudomonas phage HRDY3 TaxID=3236930 RepID=A0AB39CEC7_9VIRU